MTEYKMTYAAYDGPFRYYVIGIEDNGEVSSEHGFNTKSETLAFLDEMNDSPEWREFCSKGGE